MGIQERLLKYFRTETVDQIMKAAKHDMGANIPQVVLDAQENREDLRWSLSLAGRDLLRCVQYIQALEAKVSELTGEEPNE